MLRLLADIPPDPLGGWTQVILQGGAFSLLTYLVCVLAPRMISETRQEREKRDTVFSELISSLQARFEVRNDILCAAIDRQTTQISAQLRANNEQVSHAIAHSCRVDGRRETDFQPRPPFPG